MPDRTEPRDAQHVREPHPFEAVPVAPGVSTLVAVRDPDPNAPALASDGLSQDEIRIALDSLEVIDETYSADRWRR